MAVKRAKLWQKRITERSLILCAFFFNANQIPMSLSHTLDFTCETGIQTSEHMLLLCNPLPWSQHLTLVTFEDKFWGSNHDLQKTAQFIHSVSIHVLGKNRGMQKKNFHFFASVSLNVLWRMTTILRQASGQIGRGLKLFAWMELWIRPLSGRHKSQRSYLFIMSDLKEGAQQM